MLNYRRLLHWRVIAVSFLYFSYFISSYDDEVDKVNQYQKLNLEDLEKIEIGPEPTFFGKPKFSCMRLHYKYKGISGYFHTLRAVTRYPEEDGKDTLQCIAEMLKITKQALELDVPIIEKKLERKSSKPHEDILGIKSSNAARLGLNAAGLTQSKNFLMSKFSSLNQKVKQTKTNVNMTNLRKLGNFPKPEMKAFLRPNLKVSLCKSDSSLENPRVDIKDNRESDMEMSSDSDSFYSDEFLPNSKSDDERQLSGSMENVGQVDFVLPSCGIIASIPRLGSRSQSVSSAEMNMNLPTEIHVTVFDSDSANVESECESNQSSSCSQNALIDFDTPVDAYCHKFAQDAQTKNTDQTKDGAISLKAVEEPNQTKNSEANTSSALQKAEAEPIPRPSQLPVPVSEPGHQSSNDQPLSAGSLQKSPKTATNTLEKEPDVDPLTSDSNNGRAVSPFAKIRSSMVQVANITQAGLTQGINFAVAKVQKSPEPEAVNETNENELKEKFTLCQTRIIQI